MTLIKSLKILGVSVVLLAVSGVAYSCYKTKQCCKRDYTGNLICQTKCDYQMCPYNYPIEIK